MSEWTDGFLIGLGVGYAAGFGLFLHAVLTRRKATHRDGCV